jgi:hypothetical protein
MDLSYNKKRHETKYHIRIGATRLCQKPMGYLKDDFCIEQESSFKYPINIYT